MVSAQTQQPLLVIDDEPDLLTLYELTLVREGYDVVCAGSLAEARAALERREFLVVITDMRLPDGSGLDLLKQLEASGRPERVIVITAYGSAENAVEALKAGAFDYLTKPVDLKQFRNVVASAARRQARDGPNAALPMAGGAVQRLDRSRGARSASTAAARLVGDSAAMQNVRALIERVARSMAPVLVQGESGTGKELVARAVHEASARAALPFVAVNCGAIPENLLEAEFFGYRKGAFTGAVEDREGFFQAAQGGTLFLDEIGDLPLAMQAKLLRVIQERAVRPVGATAEQATQVRIVSATHKDLAAEVQAGRFRQDLFYRLNVIPIIVPPLRERRSDLPQICRALLQRIAADAGAGADAITEVSEEALSLLMQQELPGNVRELENLLHRALTMASGHCIERADLDVPNAALDTEDSSAEMPWRSVTPGAPGPSQTQAPSRQTSQDLPANLQAHLDRIERDVLLRALQKHRYNRTAAGESLGLTLRQMRYRMARLGVLSDKSDGEADDTPGIGG
jgi:two-component system, NtrC family, response regulator PilR